MSAPAAGGAAGAVAASDTAAAVASADTPSAAAASAAAEEAVADLLQLQRAVAQAAASQRDGLEAAELRERLLAAAGASQPAESLVTASVLRSCVAARLAAAAPARASLRPSALQARADAVAALWRSDAALLRCSRRGLALLTARAAAGTLWTPTPAERAFFADDAAARPLELLGAEMLAAFARDALRWWPSGGRGGAAAAAAAVSGDSATDAEEPAHGGGPDAARLRGVHAALRALLERDAAGGLERCARTRRPLGVAAPAFSLAVRSLLSTLTLTAAAGAAAGAGAALLAQLRAADGGLTRDQEAALRRLAHRLSAAAEKERQRAATAPIAHASRAAASAAASGGRTAAPFGLTVFSDLRTLSRERAARGVATDAVARTALRRCALPACDTREARPRAFMLCARCRGAAYCCALHQTHDWRRHKVVDGCSPSD
jgi:hypothetical protein